MRTRIKDIMAAVGVSNVTLADRLGISKQAVGKIINAESQTTATLEKIALALNVPLWQLFVSPEEAKGVDVDTEFCAFIRRNGIHYTADSEAEFWKIVDELRMVAGHQD